MAVPQVVSGPREEAPPFRGRPLPRPDRRFYQSSLAFGRFGIRWFTPVYMERAHSHGHIELNWLSAGSMDYDFDGHAVTVPPQRIVMFWAGIPHYVTDIDLGPQNDAKQCNVYLPLDVFLHMPHLGTLRELIMSGGVICLDPDSVGATELHRWYRDYRSGDSERTDILKVELGAMFRRASIVGWEEIAPPWVAIEGPAPRQHSPARHVVAMLRHILEHLSEPLTLEDVAGVVGLHPNYAHNLFSKVMQISMRKFIVRMRLVRARALLFESNLSIANVAFQSGFTSLSQFYDHFRRAYGITPRVMRQNLIRG